MVAVTNARASATQVTIDPSNMTAESLKQFDAAQYQVGQTLSRLLVSMEKYPELKANDQFTMLQAELAGTENRIAVARRKFNEAVQNYNKDIRGFPATIWASIFGFHTSVYFEADAGSQAAPKLRMNIK
jgi:LemA protein